jgi:arylsulfatase A-like enzyme
LRQSGRFDETVICFNADHGEYMGDSSLMLKGAWSRDSIDRVPFIWSDPEDRSARTSDALASTIDLAPSILERAGVGPYYGIQGKSLLGNMAGSPELRESLLIEFNDALPRMGFERAARVRTLITNQHRMSVYQDHEWGELYDRASDAHDIHNRWADAAHAGVRAELALLLNQHLIKLMDESPTAKRLA